MNRVIITDLTRFNNQTTVCTAAIDMNTGECFRPMPYFKSNRCQELNIQPGAILEGELTLIDTAVKPHIEDASHSKLKFIERCYR